MTKRIEYINNSWVIVVVVVGGGGEVDISTGVIKPGKCQLC